MNWAHVHIALNHIPVIGILFSILLLFIGIMKKNDELKKVSLGFFVLVGASAILVFLTGEGAEEIAEHLPGVSESVIGRHEGAALLSMVAAGITGILALSGLFLYRKPKTIPVGVVTILLILSIATAGFMARAANLGGQVRHTEIRGEFQSLVPDAKARGFGT